MICENLLTLRRQKGFSQEHVAEAVGVSRQAVAKWEAGETTPDIENCISLAKLYDVTLDDLVNYRTEDACGLPIGPKGKYMFGIVTLGEKGQIVIPAKARRVFDLHPGDNLAVLGDVEQGLGLIRTDALMQMVNSFMSGEREAEK